MKNKFMQLANQTETSADIYIYGDIVSWSWWDEDVTANQIKNQIQDLDVNELNVHINSLGGDVFTGVAIYNLLKQHKAKVNVYVDSVAGSISSVIAMAGDKIYMFKNTLQMIHNCWTWALGNSKELRKTADDMDVIMNAIIESYLSRVKISKEELKELLDNETWLTAEECVEKGFADEIIELKESSINQSATLFNLVQKVRKLETPKQEVAPTPIEEPKEELIVEKNLKNEILEKLKGRF